MLPRGSLKLINLVVFLATVSLSSSQEFGICRDELFELSVIHLNDFHARFVETSSASATCNVGDECVGGIARVYTATNQLVNERPNAILLNAGDNFQGTLWYNVHGWNVTAFFMNMLPIDVMTIGNHEFDNRLSGLEPYLEMLTCPVVVTNIDDSNEPDIQGMWTNSTIIERDGVLIGVIGVIASNTHTLSSTEKLIFLDEVTTVNAEAERLKCEGVEIIIVLSHCGFDVDQVLASSCPNVDLVVGGHTHTMLYTGTPPGGETAEDVYPVVVTQDTGRTVLIVQAYAFSKYLGNLSVWFDYAGEVADWEGNPILLDGSIEQDPDVLAAMAPWQVDVDALGEKVVGSTSVDLYNDCRIGECNIGDLITDAMIDAWAGMAEESGHWAYAAIACINAGGIRASISSSPGTITYGDAVLVQPFENTWDVIELNGTALVNLLERSVLTSESSTQFYGKSFLQWSGINATMNLSNPQYSRVTSVQVRCQACETPVYEPVVDDQWYRIVTLSYLIQGGDGWDFKTVGRNHQIGTLDIASLVDYITKMSPITTQKEGRLTLVGTWSG